MSASELQLLGLSIRIALLATSLAFPFALVTAWFLASNRGRSRFVVDVLVSLPLVLPPVVSGYGLLLLLRRDGPLGGFLFWLFGVDVVFTWVAASLAAGIIIFPLMVRSMEIALSGVDRRLVSVARSLGSGPIRAFLTITLPLAAKGLAAGTLLGFIRGLGEFGATIVVAGNIPGQTQTLTLAIFTSLETGQDDMVVRLIIFSAGLAIVTLIGYAFLLSRRPSQRI